MQKEIEPLQQLESRKESLTKGIGRINDIYLSDPLRIGQVEVGTSIGNTLEVGRTKAAARKLITGLNSRLEQVGSELNADSEARLHNEKVDQKKKELAEMSELAAGDNIPIFILEKYQQEFEELVNLPQTNPLLQRGLDRIRQEEETERKSLIEVLPDGKVRLPNGVEIRGKRAKLLSLLKDSSENNLVSTIQLAEKVYPDLEESKGRQISSTHLGHLKEKLGEARLELVSVMPTVRERRLGSKGGYFLKRLGQPLLTREQENSQDSEPQPNNEFRFEDGVEVRGVEASLLNKLFPFGRNHLVTRNELIQEIEAGETAIDSEVFDQYAGDISRLLNWRRFRLGELPNPNDPENNGYYVEDLRGQSVHMTLLGEVVRHRNIENQVVQTRLPEKEASLLWALSGGDPKLDTDLAEQLSENPVNVVETLNTNLNNLTGVEDVIVSVGDDEFGNWYRTNDTFIARRRGYSPLHPTRQEALRIIFQDDPETTKEEVIQTLGPTRGGRQTPRLLANHQAITAIRNSAARLANRTREGISTEEEMDLHSEMQDYMRKHNLVDIRSLVSNIGRKLGFTQASLAADNVEEADSGVASLPAMSVDEEILEDDQPDGSIEDPEFGNLSRVDVSLVAQRLEFNRVSLEPLLQQRGVRLIEEEISLNLMRLVEGQEIEAQEQLSRGDIGEAEFVQLMSDYRTRAFEKARGIITSPDLNSILDKIGDQNPYVWGLLVNLYEIDESIRREGQEEGISLLAQNPEVIKAVLENPASESVSESADEEIEVPGDETDQLTGVDEEQVQEAVVDKSNGQKLIPLERRDPEIRTTINQYLDEILEIPELNGPVTPAMVTRFFPRLKTKSIDVYVEKGWVQRMPSRSNRRSGDQGRFDSIAVATMRYLYENRTRLNPRLSSNVQKIVREVFDRRKEK